MEKIDELTQPPIIGKYYLVPCILSKVVGLKHHIYIPIYGTKHNDIKTLNVYQYHYHIDYRFVPKQIRMKLLPYQWLKKKPVEYETYLFLSMRNIVNKDIVYIKKLCLKETLFFPIDKKSELYISVWKPQFEDFFLNQKATLQDGFICPHKGTKLGSFKVCKGHIVCPAHGLKFNIENQQIVQR